MTGNIHTLRADKNWLHYVNHIDQGINCACCNGFIYRFFKNDAYRLVYGVGANSMPWADTDFTPEEFRLFLNVVYERRYFFGKCALDANTSTIVLTSIVNVRRLPDNELAEALLI